jgi:hypothetical protein
VHYCIVGSYALAFHARPRYTKDLDVLIEATPDNARRILAALEEFGFRSLDITVEDLCEDEQIIQLGYEPVRIDLITSIKGLDFRYVCENRVKGSYGSETVNYIDRENFVKSKKLSNRLQDKADLELILESE